VKVAPLRPRRSRSAPKTADWRRQKQVIKRALGKIDPLAPAQMDCLHDVIDAVRVIANQTLRESSGEMKSQLEATATVFRKARSTLMSLSDRLRYCALFTLDAPERFIGDLDRLIERCDDQAGKIRPRRIQWLDQSAHRSSDTIEALVQASKITTRPDEPKGGSRAARLDAARKAYAAIAAFELLARYGDGFPKGARFYRTASLLIEAATGRAGVDCKAACLACSLPVRRQDAFRERAWRRRESPTTAEK
jgi:hypothetical protein